MTTFKMATWRGLMAGALLITFWLPAVASDIPMLSDRQLLQMLDDPNVIILDVRATKDWQSSDRKIKGAVRKAPQNYESWAADLPKEKALVLY